MRDDLDEHYEKMRQDFDNLEYRLGGESRFLGLEVPFDLLFNFILPYLKLISFIAISCISLPTGL